MGGTEKKKAFKTQSGRPESQCAGDALWPRNPPSPVPPVRLTPLDLSSSRGQGTAPARRAGRLGRGAEAAGEAPGR